jgi:hypothetical protein
MGSADELVYVKSIAGTTSNAAAIHVTVLFMFPPPF